MPTYNSGKIFGQFSSEAVVEVLTRLLLFITFLITDNMQPFIRVIQPEEYWLYRFPTERSYVPVNLLYVSPSTAIANVFNPMMMIVTGFAVIGAFYGINRKLKEACSAVLVITLALPLTGIITNIIKVSVGRPRPDYFNRCYGSNYLSYLDLKYACTGDTEVVTDGRKSFPSGHSSMSFCIFGFAFLYTAGQLGTFSKNHTSGSWRLVVSLLPLVIATLVAISRTCDYHHHWQDVTVGSILGYAIVYIVYRQYFHGLYENDSGKSYPGRATNINASLSSSTASQFNGHSSIRSIQRGDPRQSISANTHLVKTV